VQVRCLVPPLEHAPDQIASRPSVTLSMIAVPVANDAEPVLPTLTLIPDGFDVTRSPLRPVADTVSVAIWAAGVTVSVVALVTPAYVAEMVTGVDAATVDVDAEKVAVVVPAGTVMVAGTLTAALPLDSAITAPPAGAALESVAVPCELAPPVTVAGFIVTLCKLAGAGAPVVTCGRTAIASRKKSRDVELATLVTRTRKLAFARLAALHVRPHVSVAPPSVNVVRAVPSVPVTFAVVQVAPPSAESCTHIRGVPDVLSARARSRTSMPPIAEPAGIAKP